MAFAARARALFAEAREGAREFGRTARVLAVFGATWWAVDRYVLTLTVLHGPAAGDVRSMWFTRSDVQDTCHLCDLPHDYNRVTDVLFWLATGALLAVVLTRGGARLPCCGGARGAGGGGPGGGASSGGGVFGARILGRGGCTALLRRALGGGGDWAGPKRDREASA